MSLCNLPGFNFLSFPLPGLPSFPSISLSLPFPSIGFSMGGCALD